MTTTPFDDLPAVVTHDDVIALVMEALPDVVIEWKPLPDDRAWVLTGEAGGEAILIHNYYGPHDPRPLLCQTHGIQRHDWNGHRFVCKVCK